MAARLGVLFVADVGKAAMHCMKRLTVGSTYCTSNTATCGREHQLTECRMVVKPRDDSCTATILTPAQCNQCIIIILYHC